MSDTVSHALREMRRLDEDVAIKLALSLLDVPRQGQSDQPLPLPDDVTSLLKIAIGDEQALDTAIAETGDTRERIIAASQLFLKRMIVDPTANHYGRLGCKRDDPFNKLRLHMALLLKWLHPDAVQASGVQTDVENTNYTTAVTQAWDNVKTPERRAAYDALLKEQAASKPLHPAMQGSGASAGRQDFRPPKPASRHSASQNRRQLAGTWLPRLLLGPGLLVMVAVSLIYIAKVSLPFAVAQDRTELALLLNNQNPVALRYKGRKLMRSLFDVASDQNENTASSEDGGSNASLSRAQLEDRLRARIRQIAARLQKNVPLEAAGYRLMGQAIADQSEIREQMKRAIKRSRRETVAVAWLLHDAFAQSDPKAVLQYSDVILRTRPTLAQLPLPYMQAIAQTPEGLDQLARVLATAPPWRRSFVQALSVNAPDRAILISALVASVEKRIPLTTTELAPLVRSLLAERDYATARNLWASQQGATADGAASRLFNGGFEEKQDGLPFRWVGVPAQGAQVDFQPLVGAPEGKRALVVRTGPGRVKFPGLYQITTLTPGRYELSMKARSTLATKGDFYWRVSCLSKDTQSFEVGRSENLVNMASDWGSHAIGFDVPAGSVCEAQEVRLLFKAERTSQMLSKGEFWIDDMTIIADG